MADAERLLSFPNEVQVRFREQLLQQLNREPLARSNGFDYVKQCRSVCYLHVLKQIQT